MEAEHIEIQSTLTPGDVVRFQYFHFLHRPLRVASIFLLAFGLFAAIFMAFPASDASPNNWISFWPYALVILLWIVLPYWKAKRQFKVQPVLTEPATFTFDSGGYGTARASASSRVKWNVVLRVLETKSLMLVYHAPNMAMIIPKRSFEDQGQMSAWRTLVERQIAPKKIKAPGWIGRWF